MAIDTIKFKRGVKSKLNNLSYGEPAYISDENELYIGTEDGVEKITRNKEVAELSSQLEHIESNQNALKVSNFGTGVDALIIAINLGNEKKLPVDIDIDITLPLEWCLDDMIDVKTKVFSSVGIRITYCKYGIPIFLIKENNIEFGRGIEFYWNGITPLDGNAPQSWGDLKIAMGFNVSYNYNRNTSTAPLVFLGVDGKCMANFTSASDDNLIYNCIAFLPKTSTSRHSLYIDSVFDGVIFGLNSQNFNGLHGRVKGKRYGNLASSGVAPGHLIYLTSVGTDLPVWSTDIDIYCDDTEAVCVTDGLVQDDVSLKFLSSESIRVFVASNRPHGALDLLGVRNVEFTCFSDRQINRRGTEYSPFAFRVQGGNFNNPVSNSKDCMNIKGSVIYNIINDSIERGVLVTGTYSRINNVVIDYLCNCNENAKNIGTVSGDNSKHDFKLSMDSSSAYNDGDILLSISGNSYNEKLSISLEFLNETKNRFRIAQGNANIGDVTVIDKNSTLNVDTNIKRVVERKLSTFQGRVSGASTTPITIPHYLITGNYEIEIESVSDSLDSFYKCTYFLSVKGNNCVINKINEYGVDGLKWTPSVVDNNLIITPSTNQSSNYKVIIVKS